uniref:NADH dehydrogenase [ubiquinone] 1 alpha subcomplex subunit 2 n=1 Tax=Lepeophtheirus salmonis TaxID=72036 RepID=A0A0K2U4Z8_LEPSM|nr:NADH dehydrogenase [ubiquinone] 1 alpha subcomplex subunit 2-like [Lepeophtheirus salmonis]
MALRLSPALREIRLHLCQTSQASKGVREFIEQHYVTVKKGNPKFPIRVRECSGITPKLWARYGYGKENSFDLTDKSPQDIMSIVKNL